VVIPENELKVLQSFNGHGNITLSAYLRLDNRQHRDTAYSEFMERMQESLDECGSSPDCLEALQEDMEIVGLYLKSNGHRHVPALAIFSCAAELFWRAYPLPEPLPTRVLVGPRFHVEPLVQAVEERDPA
jgi:hypothetical protein